MDDDEITRLIADGVLFESNADADSRGVLS
jgi:hypothetical protein